MERRRVSDPKGELLSKIPWWVKPGLWAAGKWLGGLSKEKRMDLFGSALKYILGLKFLEGYRTQIAGIGAISLGIYLITQGEATQGATAILTGLGALGLGGKLDQATEATNANTLVVAGTSPEVSNVKPADAAIIAANLPGPIPKAAPASVK